jgi:hypothetical protein
VADLLDGIARHLAGLGLIAYETAGTGGNTFLESMPDSPDEAVALTLYDSAEPDSKLGYDEPRLQVRCRGTRDRRVSRERCQAIYDELNGLGPLALPDGTELILCFALQGGPVSLGVDAKGRHEHVTNYQLEHRSLTKHRV